MTTPAAVKRVPTIKARKTDLLPFSELEGFEQDIRVASKLQAKQRNAHQRGLDFNMTFQSMKNILKAKRCFYTGVELTDSRCGNLPTDVTIERVDNTKGYVIGNVVACSFAANNIKSTFESPNSKFDLKTMIKMFSKIQKKMSK